LGGLLWEIFIEITQEHARGRECQILPGWKDNSFKVGGLSNFKNRECFLEARGLTSNGVKRKAVFTTVVHIQTIVGGVGGHFGGAKHQHSQPRSVFEAHRHAYAGKSLKAQEFNES